MNIKMVTLVALFFGVALSQAALATREVIDTVCDPVTHVCADWETFDGYCDYDGTNCEAGRGSGHSDYKLPFSASFDGGATFTDTVYLRGDGRLSFGGTGDYYYYEYTGQGPNLGNTIVKPGTPSLATLQAGIDNRLTNDIYSPFVPSDTPDENTPQIYLQISTVTSTPTSLTVHFFNCARPPCEETTMFYYDMTLSAALGGIRVDATYYDASHYGELAGWTTASGASGSTLIDGPTLSFVMPAILTGAMIPEVPEPASWALMMLGFGMIGAAIRHRSGRVNTPPGAAHPIRRARSAASAP